ncbi:hypothetical protein Tco_1270074, partial [Tanacetum coccineum]
MERRDWNELPVYYLVEVLGRVGIELLVEAIPLVCKTSMMLSSILNVGNGSRGNGLVTEIVFHPSSHLKEGQIAWMAQQCCSLKQLVLPNHLSYMINYEVLDSICYLRSLCQKPDLEGLKLVAFICPKMEVEGLLMCLVPGFPSISFTLVVVGVGPRIIVFADASVLLRSMSEYKDSIANGLMNEEFGEGRC